MIAADVHVMRMVSRLHIELTGSLGNLLQHELRVQEDLVLLDLLSRGTEEVKGLLLHELDAELGEDPFPATIQGRDGVLGEDLVPGHSIDEHGCTSRRGTAPLPGAATWGDSRDLWNSSSIKWNNAAMAAPAGTQAVDRAGALLVDILKAPGSLSFAQLQSSSGLAKSTLSRLLSSLQRQGLVNRTADGALEPGHVLSQYAMSARPVASLIRLARPHLLRLSEACGETINLAVIVGNEVEQVDQVDCRFLMGVTGSTDWVGQRVPLHCSAVGKVFLASGTPLPAGDLERRTAKSIASRDELLADLNRARELGWALAESELEEGLVAVAAPVRAQDGSVVAALAISGPATRIASDRAQELGRLVAQQAVELSAELGHSSLNSAESERPANEHRATTNDRRVGAA